MDTCGSVTVTLNGTAVAECYLNISQDKVEKLCPYLSKLALEAFSHKPQLPAPRVLMVLHHETSNANSGWLAKVKVCNVRGTTKGDHTGELNWRLKPSDSADGLVDCFKALGVRSAGQRVRLTCVATSGAGPTPGPRTKEPICTIVISLEEPAAKLEPPGSHKGVQEGPAPAQGHAPPAGNANPSARGNCLTGQKRPLPEAGAAGMVGQRPQIKQEAPAHSKPGHVNIKQEVQPTGTFDPSNKAATAAGQQPLPPRLRRQPGAAAHGPSSPAAAGNGQQRAAKRQKGAAKDGPCSAPEAQLARLPGPRQPKPEPQPAQNSTKRKTPPALALPEATPLGLKCAAAALAPGARVLYRHVLHEWEITKRFITINDKGVDLLAFLGLPIPPWKALRNCSGNNAGGSGGGSPAAHPAADKVAQGPKPLIRVKREFKIKVKAIVKVKDEGKGSGPAAPAAGAGPPSAAKALARGPVKRIRVKAEEASNGAAVAAAKTAKGAVTVPGMRQAAQAACQERHHYPLSLFTHSGRPLVFGKVCYYPGGNIHIHRVMTHLVEANPDMQPGDTAVFVAGTGKHVVLFIEPTGLRQQAPAAAEAVPADTQQGAAPTQHTAEQRAPSAAAAAAAIPAAVQRAKANGANRARGAGAAASRAALQHARGQAAQRRPMLTARGGSVCQDAAAAGASTAAPPMFPAVPGCRGWVVLRELLVGTGRSVHLNEHAGAELLRRIQQQQPPQDSARGRHEVRLQCPEGKLLQPVILRAVLEPSAQQSPGACWQRRFYLGGSGLLRWMQQNLDQHMLLACDASGALRLLQQQGSGGARAMPRRASGPAAAAGATAAGSTIAMRRRSQQLQDVGMPDGAGEQRQLQATSPQEQDDGQRPAKRGRKSDKSWRPPQDAAATAAMQQQQQQCTDWVLLTEDKPTTSAANNGHIYVKGATGRELLRRMQVPLPSQRAEFPMQLLGSDLQPLAPDTDAAARLVVYPKQLDTSRFCEFRLRGTAVREWFRLLGRRPGAAGPGEGCWAPYQLLTRGEGGALQLQVRRLGGDAEGGGAAEEAVLGVAADAPQQACTMQREVEAAVQVPGRGEGPGPSVAHGVRLGAPAGWRPAGGASGQIGGLPQGMAEPSPIGAMPPARAGPMPAADAPAAAPAAHEPVSMDFVDFSTEDECSAEAGEGAVSHDAPGHRHGSSGGRAMLSSLPLLPITCEGHTEMGGQMEAVAQPRKGGQEAQPAAVQACMRVSGWLPSGAALPFSCDTPGQALRMCGVTFHPSLGPMVEAAVRAWQQRHLPVCVQGSQRDPPKLTDVPMHEQLALPAGQQQLLLLQSQPGGSSPDPRLQPSALLASLAELLGLHTDPGAPLPQALGLRWVRPCTASPGVGGMTLRAARVIAAGSVLGPLGGCVMRPEDHARLRTQGHKQLAAAAGARGVPAPWRAPAGCPEALAWSALVKSYSTPFEGPLLPGGAAPLPALRPSAAASASAGPPPLPCAHLVLCSVGYGNEAALINDPAGPDVTGISGLSHGAGENVSVDEQPHANCQVALFAVRGVVLPFVVCVRDVREGEELRRSYGQSWWDALPELQYVVDHGLQPSDVLHAGDADVQGDPGDWRV